MDNRIKTYSNLSTELSLQSDQSLVDLLSKATPIGASIGGTASSIDVCDKQVFIKKIPLTDLERQPANRMSTSNLFELPLYCQYGLGSIGSPGFGAWRELAVNKMCTNWVLSGECQSFPLMYHWRVLPGSPQLSDEHKNIENSVCYWEGSPAVRTRLEGKKNASAEIVLFLEHVPSTLHEWFGMQIAKGGEVASSTISMVESNLEATTSFINSHGLVHFDVHFRNILTDGHRLYFADFGLASCNRFDLSEIESAFLKHHRDYDRFYTQTQLVHWLCVALFGENSDLVLEEYAAGKEAGTVDSSCASILKKYAPVASVMKKFFRKFQNESRLTQFPVNELKCAAAGKHF